MMAGGRVFADEVVSRLGKICFLLANTVREIRGCGIRCNVEGHYCASGLSSNETGLNCCIFQLVSSLHGLTQSLESGSAPASISTRHAASC